MWFRVLVCVCVCMYVVTKAKPKVIVRLVMSEQWTWGRRFTHGQGSNWQMITFRLIVQHKNTNIIAKMYFCVISKRYFQPQRFLAWSIDLESVFSLAFLLFFWCNSNHIAAGHLDIMGWGKNVYHSKAYLWFFSHLQSSRSTTLFFFYTNVQIVLWKFILLSALKCSK